MKARNAIGVTVTLVYCGLVAYWCWTHQVPMRELKPNEMGDFLAGVFGPLAFLWLVLGYLQQGDELQQNTKALEMQARELENSVRHQAELVDVTREQLQADMAAIQEEQRRQAEAAKPKFRFSHHGSTPIAGGRQVNYRCVNVGNTAVDIHAAYSDASVNLAPARVHALGRGAYVDFGFQVPDASVLPATLTLSFTDSAGVSGEATFVIAQGQRGPWDWEFTERA